MSSGLRFAIYEPPEPDLPFLAAMIATDGEVIVVPYQTAIEAERHNELMSERANKLHQKLRREAEDEDGA